MWGGWVGGWLRAERLALGYCEWDEDDVKVLRSKVLEETNNATLNVWVEQDRDVDGATRSRAVCKNRVGRRAASAALRGR